jgi:hypothetical protein
MNRRSSILFLFAVLASSSAALQSKALAQCDSAVLQIHIDSVFARETGSEIDQRLGNETLRLRTLFHYSSYQLVRTEEADTPCGQEVPFFLPDGRILHVRPLATHGNLVALELALFAGARALMRQQLEMMKGSGLLVFATSEAPQNTYITCLTIDSPLSGPGIGAVGSATAVATPLPHADNPNGTK